jgi:hypothetical protein
MLSIQYQLNELYVYFLLYSIHYIHYIYLFMHWYTITVLYSNSTIVFFHE